VIITNTEPADSELVDLAIEHLARRLPEGWRIERAQILPSNSASPIGGAINIIGPNSVAAMMIVEAKRSAPPREVERVVRNVNPALRAMAGSVGLLLVAPWLSENSRALLEDAGWNYIDLSGNVRVAATNPTLYLRLDGARKDPRARPRGVLRLRGKRTGRLLRFLCEVRPPYGVREIAAATGLNPGWVSTLLSALDAEALIDRGKRGDVISADPVGIVRRWSDSYDLLKTNTAHTFITPNGARRALQSLLEAQTVAIRWGVTGSFGAVELAPVAAPALLTVYVSAPDLVARELGLLPAEQGVDVVLLSPYDEVVWDRMTNRNGISIVAPPQLAIDCLTGTGRMPAEGEAVLTWMAEREDEWRIPSLAQLTGASS
jgi:hypothetical protein